MSRDQIHEYKCCFVKERVVTVHIRLHSAQFYNFYREYHDERGKKVIKKIYLQISALLRNFNQLSASYLL